MVMGGISGGLSVKCVGMIRSNRNIQGGSAKPHHLTTRGNGQWPMEAERNININIILYCIVLSATGTN